MRCTCSSLISAVQIVPSSFDLLLTLIHICQAPFWLLSVSPHVPSAPVCSRSFQSHRPGQRRATLYTKLLLICLWCSNRSSTSALYASPTWQPYIYTLWPSYLHRHLITLFMKSDSAMSIVGLTST